MKVVLEYFSSNIEYNIDSINIKCKKKVVPFDSKNPAVILIFVNNTDGQIELNPIYSKKYFYIQNKDELSNIDKAYILDMLKILDEIRIIECNYLKYKETKM
jgi:hypothetical protein